MTVRCGHKTHDLAVAKIHHHESVSMVRTCFSLEYGAYSLEEMAAMSEDELHDYADTLEAAQSCSICDGLGHGYPGGRPCPLEENEQQWVEADAEERMAALFAGI